MKLFLLHGNFQTALIKKLSDIKSGFDPLSITENDSAGIFSSQNLFTDKRLIILENPDIKLLEKIVSETDPGLTVILKFSKALEKSSVILKKVLEIKGEVLSFDETSQVAIFPLLDLLGNRNPKAFGEFEKNYAQWGGQYILTMLAYFLRRMIQKPKSSSDFMRQKIETQKRNFNLEKITKLYRKVIETDFKIKQGLAEEKMEITMLVQKILIAS